jgi:hypothetical protein
MMLSYDPIMINKYQKRSRIQGFQLDFKTISAGTLVKIRIKQLIIVSLTYLTRTSY